MSIEQAIDLTEIDAVTINGVRFVREGKQEIGSYTQAMLARARSALDHRMYAQPPIGPFNEELIRGFISEWEK